MNKDKLAEEELKSNKFIWLENIISREQITELTREILLSIVENIYINKDEEIRIVFKYADEFEQLVNYTKASKMTNIHIKEAANE